MLHDLFFKETTKSKDVA